MREAARASGLSRRAPRGVAADFLPSRRRAAWPRVRTARFLFDGLPAPGSVAKVLPPPRAAVRWLPASNRPLPGCACSRAAAVVGLPRVGSSFAPSQAEPPNNRAPWLPSRPRREGSVRVRPRCPLLRHQKASPRPRVSVRSRSATEGGARAGSCGPSWRRQVNKPFPRAPVCRTRSPPLWSRPPGSDRSSGMNDETREPRGRYLRRG